MSVATIATLETASLNETRGDPERSKAISSAANRFYRPELDVVRFLAFVLVFIHHFFSQGSGPGTANLPKGLTQVIHTATLASGFGLSLFFTLSAFLICELLLRERETTSDVQAKQFYFRRILRIWPLYFAGLGIAILLALVSGGDQAVIPWAAWSAILVGNWYLVFHIDVHSPMGVLWSISVEEQFYLFAPWAIKFLSRRSLIAFSFALISCSNVWLFFLGRAQVTDNAIWDNSFVQFENFAAGMLLCLLLRGKLPQMSAWVRLAMIATAGILWYLAVGRLHVRFLGLEVPGSKALVGGYALAALGCSVFLGAFLGVDKMVLPDWAIYLGRISYGLYVFHMLAIYLVVSVILAHLHLPLVGSSMMILKGAASLGLTILLASLSYRFFETPFLKLKKRHEIIASRPI